MTTPTKPTNPKPDGDEIERELEGLAMNIVFQIGDALYEALPKDIARDHFVDARQKTNDVAIDFAKKLISAHTEAKVREAEEKRLLELKAYWDNLAKQYDLYTTVGHIQSWVDKRLIELAQPPKEES